MKKYWLLGMFLATAFVHVQAQEEDEPAPPAQRGFDKSKLFFGGNFGLSFGNSTFINISPQIGYRFNQYLAAGAGVNFNYRSLKTEYTGGVTEREKYGYGGLNIFGRLYPIQYILIQAQPEINYNWASYSITGAPTQKLPGLLVPSLLLGAGGVIPAGGRNGALILMLQYDVIQAARNPYGNKVFFSFGYNF
ncbi:MAG: hypothetical protein KF746_10800 [Chitinophagaceae bacterium]|nr:hypothetical protein [Chitinophagaceae bacterium]